MSKRTKETALALACSEGHLFIADFLIMNGANLELGDSTPLMKAAQIGNMHLVSYLLQCGANVNAENALAETALSNACENGHTDVAEMLVQFGAHLVSIFYYFNSFLLRTFC